MANAQDTRFTLMALPQQVDAAGILSLHILFVPRNFNPLDPVNTTFNTDGETTPFVKAQPSFQAVVVNNPDEFPGKIPADQRSESLALSYSDLTEDIYLTLKNAKDENGEPKYFDIDDAYSQNPEHLAPAPIEASQSIKKYLPLSYQKAFNFTGPRTENAVTDDSYHCAMRGDKKPVPVPDNNKVSWGKVYAHLLRQPHLAEKAGLIYKTQVQLSAEDFKKGGWIYIDVPNESDYGQEQEKSLGVAGDNFIKRYAARIPGLKKEDGKFIPRSLFASVLFPVVKPGDSPKGIFDDLYIEAAEYNDGFAKIVHANQPVSGNLLSEQPNGFHPQKELGIRLGWDDEQILIWYLRQLAKDPTVDGGADRLDAPLGVMGYHVDVKDADTPGSAWESLNAVVSNGNMILENNEQAILKKIDIGPFKGELPFQVYPSKPYGDPDSSYWLPMYFANWNDHSLVLPDKTAAEIYKNVDVPISNTYSSRSGITKLRYGKSYDFRVRLTDITGGGPEANQNPADDRSSSVAAVRFKRYVAPYALRVVNKEDVHSPSGENAETVNFKGNELIVKRPLMGYPGVVYTDKYDDPVSLLRASVEQQYALYNPGVNKVDVHIGIADPDVVSVFVKVEVETLKMDNLASDDGKSNFITLYTTTRSFDSADFEHELALQFKYKDYHVLDFKDLPLHPFGNAADDACITADEGDIILPTNRNIRLTLRAKCGEGPDYWGNIGEDVADDSRYGKPLVLGLRRDATGESELFDGVNAPKLVQGIFLRPDPFVPPTGQTTIAQIRPNGQGMPGILQRLAQQLDVNCGNDGKSMTLTAERGERIQFWCSNLIRHTLSPDNGSITFAGKNEMTNRWLVATSLTIDRDWTWDALDTLAFTIARRRSTKENPIDPDDRDDFMEALEYKDIGDMEIMKVASFQSIQENEDEEINRNFTRIIFIDAIDPLPAEGAVPDTTLVQYKITPHFKSGITADEESFETRNLLLPSTTNPNGIPKIIGSGIALSPYIHSDDYSSTEPRKRFLWLEFDSLPDDERDALYARQLAYAPDQLLSNNHPSLFKNEEESPLALDPEYTRVIVADSAHDHPGIKAMQKMQKSQEKDRHFYLLPLPDGLHPESPELFGFFTYEFRFGHTDQIWSTAQGRFGRALHLTGLQHPAPNLICLVSRDDKSLRVNAPYAKAVSNGKNVTANPPRTSIWGLLYAQVMQADGKTYRNILIDERKLVLKEPYDIKTNPFVGHQGGDDIVEWERNISLLKTLKTEATQHASCSWQNEEIRQKLELYGLPEDASLSVICVEVFGFIRNITEHIDNISDMQQTFAQSVSTNLDKEVGAEIAKSSFAAVQKLQGVTMEDNSQPLGRELGSYRILRTSPLTEVPSVCCTDC